MALDLSGLLPVIEVEIKKLLAVIEAEIKKRIEAESDKVVDAALDALKKAFPGNWDDLAIEAAKAAVEKAVKAGLLSLADKISK